MRHDADAVLHVATRLRGGDVVTLDFPDHRPSPKLGDLLMAAMVAAVEAGPCPHLKPGGGWVVPVSAGRAMCVTCSFEPETHRRWYKGAPCDLCSFPVATLVLYDYWPDGEEKGVTRCLMNLCPRCVRTETGAEVTP